jgi:SagB-type dehydrogenase family enzyme
MQRIRHDLNHATSAGLLGAAVVTGATGVISDLWDLNDFWPHIAAGYAMGVLAVAHVWLNWSKLTGYVRFRLTMGRRPRRANLPAQHPGPAVSAVTGDVEQLDRGRFLARLAVSRRGVLGFAIGSAAGLVLGRGLRPLPPIPAGSDVGLIYHEWSKPGIIDALGTVANWGQQPELYKWYPGAARVPLPAPVLDGAATPATIVARRSTRSYAPEPMTAEELATVLYLATGISANRFGNARRTAPSSGALYPLEVYPVIHNVVDLERGVYHYGVRDHELELVSPGDYRAAVVDQGIGQEFLGECGAILFLTLILQRMRPRYQDRSYRYGLIEAGHVGQNVYLAAGALGLGACAVGAFMDDQINAMLGVDGREEAAIYLLAVGRLPVAA